MTFLDARWRNGYAVAGDELTVSNGSHSVGIARAVRPGAVLCSIVQEDGDAAMRYEIQLPADYNSGSTITRVQTECTQPSWIESMSSTKWIRWQIKLASPWVTDGTSGLSLAIISVHDNPTVGQSRVGTFTGYIQDGVFLLRRGNTALGTQGKTIASWPIRPGQWEDIVMQVKHATDSSGFMKIWRNQRKIVDVSGEAMTYDDDNGPYPKPGGLYYPTGYPAWISSRIAFDRGICASDDTHTFNSFMAACGDSSLVELPSVVASSIGLA